MRFKEYFSILLENQSTTTLDIIYGSELPDDNEMFWSFVSMNDFVNDYTIRVIDHKSLEKILLHQYSRKNLNEIKRMLSKKQWDVLKQKKIEGDDRPIIICNSTIVDGNHRALLAVMEKRNIKYIDLGEY